MSSLPFDSIIFYNPYNEENIEKVQEFIQSQNCTEFLERIGEKCILVLGGDGTMLKAISEHYSLGIPFIGLNFGHTGYLLNTIGSIESESVSISKQNYPLFEVHGNDEFLGVSFNDINLYSPEGRAISLEVSFDDYTRNFWGDGIIIASPVGSTGHSKSYNGPILNPNSRSLALTPKGNIELVNPVVINDEATVQIKNTGRRFLVAINIDGNRVFISELGKDIDITIKKASTTITLLKI